MWVSIRRSVGLSRHFVKWWFGVTGFLSYRPKGLPPFKRFLWCVWIKVCLTVRCFLWALEEEMDPRPLQGLLSLCVCVCVCERQMIWRGQIKPQSGCVEQTALDSDSWVSPPPWLTESICSDVQVNTHSGMVLIKNFLGQTDSFKKLMILRIFKQQLYFCVWCHVIHITRTCFIAFKFYFIVLLLTCHIGKYGYCKICY